MNMNMTQYINNQFEPKNLATQISYLEATFDIPVSWGVVTGLSITVLKSAWYIINSKFEHQVTGNTRGAAFAFSLDGTNLTGDGVTDYQPTSGTNSLISMTRGKTYLTAGEVIAVSAQYNGSQTHVLYGAGTHEGFISITEVQQNQEPNTFPFEVNAQQYALTVTGSNWTTRGAWGVPYKTTDGTWRLRFNIVGTVSSATRTNYAVTVAGVSFLVADGGAGNDHVIAATHFDNTTYPQAVIDAATSSQLYCWHGSVATTRYAFYGDAPLTAKPDWI